MAAEAHALAHTLLWTSSRDYFPANGCSIEKDSTCHPVEWFYWTSSRTDDLGQYYPILYLFTKLEKQKFMKTHLDSLVVGHHFAKAQKQEKHIGQIIDCQW